MGMLTEIALPAVLAFIMTSMGLALRPSDFRRVAAAPRAALVGLAAQFAALPLLAFALVLGWDAAFGLEPTLAVGFLLIAACPGGATSNLLTHLARGDTALSVSLTAVASVACAVTIPLILGAATAAFLGAAAPPLPLGPTIAGLFAIVTAPVLLGMAIRGAAPAFADRAEPICRAASTALFVLIVAGAVAAEWRLVVAYGAAIGPLALALNGATMAMGWLAARAAGLARPQRVAITLEAGLQNGTLAVLIAATFLEAPAMAAPGGVYSLVMFATAGLFIAGARRRVDA